jgi:hypothetical protein
MLTPSYMIYGKLGCYTMDIDIKVQTITYWARLLTGIFLYTNVYNILA